MLTFITPPGIGDISWLYSKIIDVAKDRKVGFKIANWEPQRSKNFVSLLPEIQNLGYTDKWSANKFPSGSLDWKEKDLSILEDGEYFIQLNDAIDNGTYLRDCFPFQSTYYHYALNIPYSNKQEAREFIQLLDGWPKFGVYISSYHQDDQFWDVKQFFEFFSTIRLMYPDAAFYCLGAEWDVKTQEFCLFCQERKFNIIDGVGKYDIASTLAIIQKLDYFFSYPSGLGILADVINTPTLMWYWPHRNQGLLEKYADPYNIRTGRHINIPMQSIENSLTFFKEKGQKFLFNV